MKNSKKIAFDAKWSLFSDPVMNFIRVSFGGGGGGGGGGTRSPLENSHQPYVHVHVQYMYVNGESVQHGSFAHIYPTNYLKLRATHVRKHNMPHPTFDY